MRHALLIALREFFENAKTKGFWIGILMLPAMFAVVIAISVFLATSTPTRHFVLIDQSGELEDVVEAAITQDRAPAAAGNGAPDAAGGPRRFVRIAPPSGVDPTAELSELAEQLRPYLTGAMRIDVDGQPVSLFAAILIGPDALEDVTGSGGPPPRSDPADSRIQYWSGNLADRNLPGVLGRALNEEIRAREYLRQGVSLDVVRTVEQTGISFASFDPGRARGEESVSAADTAASYVPIAFVYLLWISLFIVLQMLLNNTIEEKSNRIIEVLLSSVTPGELMMGKLLGIAAVGLAMIGMWLLMLLAGAHFYQGAGVEMVRLVLDAMSGTGLTTTFIVYFLLGYLLYAGIFLSVGSLCDSLKEAQNLQGPMMLILIVPLLTMQFIVRDPHGQLATIMTWIPLYTPFTMLNRAAANPPVVDVIGSIALMLVSTAIVLWLAGRIFRVGILRTGQRPKLVEIVRWMRGSAG